MKESKQNQHILSEEIRTLMSDVDKIITKKDEISENIKRVYLCFSTNN